MDDDPVISVSRARREQDRAPLPIFNANAENRSKLQFFWWALGVGGTLAAGIIIATLTYASIQTSIALNKADIVRAQSEAEKAQLAADTAQKLSENTAAEILRRTWIVELVSSWKSLQLEKAAPLALEMAGQREYGISNYQWYVMKHNTPPQQPADPNPPYRK